MSTVSKKKKLKKKEESSNISVFVPPVDELFPLPKAPRITITEAEYKRLETLQMKVLDLFHMAKTLDGLVVLCKVKSGVNESELVKEIRKLVEM